MYIIWKCTEFSIDESSLEEASSLQLSPPGSYQPAVVDLPRFQRLLEGGGGEGGRGEGGDGDRTEVSSVAQSRSQLKGDATAHSNLSSSTTKYYYSLKLLFCMRINVTIVQPRAACSLHPSLASLVGSNTHSTLHTRCLSTQTDSTTTTSHPSPVSPPPPGHCRPTLLATLATSPGMRDSGNCHQADLPALVHVHTVQSMYILG